MNIAIFHDDASFFERLVKQMTLKGVKIVSLPSSGAQLDAHTIVPFLLLNDHSIILVRNPKKDVMQTLKQIIRTGCVYFKEPGSTGTAFSKPISLSVTIWVFVDITGHLPTLNQQHKNPNAKNNKTIKDLMEREWADKGSELLKSFEVVLDCTQFTNLEIMGTRYLKY